MRIRVNYPQIRGPQEVNFAMIAALAPGHRLNLIVNPQTTDGESVTIKVIMEIDGDRIPVFTKHFTQDDLADIYEKAHHEHHGYDPRGLDPRVEKTRLTP